MNLRQVLFSVAGRTSQCLQIAILTFCSLPVVAQTPAPPPTRQDNLKETIHGVEIVDPYRWLEDQDSEETRKWVAAQNAYTHSLLDKLPQRAAISKQLMEMLKHDTIGFPREENGYYFFFKKGADQDLSASIGAKGLQGRMSC